MDPKNQKRPRSREEGKGKRIILVKLSEVGSKKVRWWSQRLGVPLSTIISQALTLFFLELKALLVTKRT